jgi:antitoxin (DNA-binding transcriptional repressor) of toxin-antitoxin stability system
MEMDISVTNVKARCLDLIRKVEENGESVTIRRKGRVVARLASWCWWESGKALGAAQGSRR